MTTVQELIALKNANDTTGLKGKISKLLNEGGEDNVAVWNDFNKHVETTDNDYKIDLREARLDGNKLRGARFVNTNLSDAILEGDFTGTSFDGAWLTRADLSDTKLNKASFDGAEIAGANFSRASLQNAKFTNALNEQEKPENQGTGKRASFEGADLTNADFSGADLHDVKWDSATRLNGVDITTAKNVPEDLKLAIIGAQAKKALLEPLESEHLPVIAAVAAKATGLQVA